MPLVGPELALHVREHLPQVLLGLVEEMSHVLIERLAEAELLMRRALKIDEVSFGPDHPNVAIRLNNLAALLRDTNRPSEAELLIRRALSIDEASYGPDHPEVATSLNNLAELLRVTNRVSEAEPLSRRHVEIFVLFTVRTGHEHPHLRAALGNYAVILEELGFDASATESRLRELLQPLNPAKPVQPLQTQ